MQKIVSIICALMIALLFPAAILVSRGLPADTRAHVAKKYDGWSGVLQAWVCYRWQPGGSFISWLNGCAAEFEKDHEGVYVEFIPVGVREMRAMLSGGMRAPEMILFSPGVPENANGLSEAPSFSCIRKDLAGCGGGYALPVAMGGYSWVCNSGMEDSAVLTLPADDGAHSYSAAAIGLMNAGASEIEIEYEQPGIDLGLPAYAGQEGIVRSEDALDDFINGGIPMTIVNQAGLARLNRFRENGRGPDWACRASGAFAFTDQLLLLAFPLPDGADALERRALSEDFARQLLSSGSQAKLAEAGAFSVTGEVIHSDFSPYAKLDRHLNGARLFVPDCFSEYSQRGAEAIVREVYAGQCSAEDALARLGLNAALP